MKTYRPIKLHPYQEAILKSKGPLVRSGGNYSGKTSVFLRNAIDIAKSGKETVGIYTRQTPAEYAKLVRSLGYQCRRRGNKIFGKGWHLTVITVGK